MTEERPVPGREGLHTLQTCPNRPPIPRETTATCSGHHSMWERIQSYQQADRVCGHDNMVPCGAETCGSRGHMDPCPGLAHSRLPVPPALQWHSPAPKGITGKVCVKKGRPTLVPWLWSRNCHNGASTTVPQLTQPIEAMERTGRMAETCATSKDQSMHGWWSLVSCFTCQSVSCEIWTGPGR